MSTLPKKKVLIIGSVPPPHHGCNVFVQQLLNSSLQQRFDIVHLDTSDRRNLDNISKLDFTNVRLAITHVFRLIQICIKDRPALAHLALSQNTLGFLRDGLFLLALRWFSKARPVVHLHGSYFPQFYRSAPWLVRRFVDAILRRVSRGIVLGQALRPIFSPWLPDSRIEVVPNGSSLLPHLNGKFERNGRRELRVIYLGNLFKFKGVLDLIEAAAIALQKHPEVKFCFAGSWGYDPIHGESAESIRGQCEARVAATGKPDRFEFLGALTGRALQDYLVDGDIFAFPSTLEGMPLVILEAMAAGNPVISSRGVGVISEVVIDGECGILVEKSNPTALAKAIMALIEDADLRRRLGRNARRRFEQYYTTEKSLATLAGVFEKTLVDETE